jgi:hypothetical protein
MTNVTSTSKQPMRPAGSDNPPLTGVGVSRIGALTGLAGIVCYLVGVLWPGSPPKPDAVTGQIVTYFADHRGAILFGFALETVALALLLCFLGELRTVIAGTGGSGAPLASAMAAAWVVLLTMIAAALLPSIALVWRGVPTNDPGLVRLAYDMETLGTYAVTAMVALVAVGVPSLVIWRTGVLPRWLGVLGLLEVCINVAELAGLSSRYGVLTGGYVAGVGPLVWALWVAAVSVSMTLRAGTAEWRLPDTTAAVPS